LTPIERSLGIYRFTSVVKNPFFIVIGFIVNVLGVASPPTNDLECIEKALRNITTPMARVVECVGNGTSGPWVFSKKVGGIYERELSRLL